MPMRMMTNIIITIALFLHFTQAATSFIGGASTTKKDKRIMTWLCLEFCQESAETIQANLQQLKEHRNVLTAVSFEKYTLGPNSSLVDNQLTPVAATILDLGFESWPLLSSYPHPPEFIDWMRTVFATPQPFIDSCISEAKLYGYTGYNLDWEPTDNVTADDGLAYASFVEVFANQLHAAGLQLTVDMATWGPIWNYSALANTSLDRAVSMGTYTGTDTSFTKQLDLLVDAFGGARSGVGLMTVNATDNSPLSFDEMQWRFQLMRDAGVEEVDIWCSPVPENWWPLLHAFKHN